MRSQEKQKERTRKKKNVVKQQDGELVGENEFFPPETTQSDLQPPYLSQPEIY